MSRRLTAAVLAASAAVLLAGCSGDGSIDWNQLTSQVQQGVDSARGAVDQAQAKADELGAAGAEAKNAIEQATVAIDQARTVAQQGKDAGQEAVTKARVRARQRQAGRRLRRREGTRPARGRPAVAVRPARQARRGPRHGLLTDLSSGAARTWADRPARAGTRVRVTHEPTPLSGAQITLALDDQTATVTDVGAKLRTYTVGDRDVITPFDVDEPAPAGHGAVLAPWPNRIRDGRYTFAGVERQLHISEPSRMTALHGLVMWQRWTVTERSGSAVTLETRTAPSSGYPYDLLIRVTYRLTATGLHVQTTATNLGTATAPYGVGFHPWLSPGAGSLDECTVRLDATTRVTTDDRLLPIGTEPAAGDFDLREPRSARGLDLDDAYVDVLRDDDGLSWIRLTGSDGRTAAVWMDESMDTWQVCTGDHLDAVGWRRTGLAAEPMSCIADAFRTGERLVHLEPGQTHEVTWGMTLL